MTRQQFEKARELQYKIEVAEDNIEAAKGPEPKIRLASVDQDTAEEWRKTNEAFWREEIKKLEQALAAL